MKFKRIVAFALLLMILLPQLVSAKELPYWYSDSNRIGKVNNHYVFRVNYSDGLSAADFTKYTTHARNQWKNAGINTYEGASESNATINWYGGSVKQLEAKEPELKKYAAVTVVDHQHVRYDTYNGKNISNRKVTKSKIYTPKKALFSAKKYRTMYTHELGHALGYFRP